MNNDIQILYNGINLFSGICPTPFVSIDQDFINFNTTWNNVTKMKMNGQLTGRDLSSLSYYEITSGFNLLLNRLSNNYGSLVISEQSQNLFSGNNVIVDSITTEESSWYGILPFTVSFDIYETGFFNNYYGVIEPEETIEFSEEDGLIVGLTQSISARGLKTGNNNAIESAKNWVKTRTGNYNKIIPIIVATANGSNFLLNSTKETIDRFNGTYSWQGVYTKSNSLESPKNAILNYTIDLSSGIEDGIITTNLQGSLTNNETTGTISLRSEYLNYNFYSIANNATLLTYNTNLNTNPISQSVTEELDQRNLNFNLTYNNDLLSNLINDYTVDISTDAIKNITNVSLNAKITAKYGDIGTRWNLVQDYYNNNFNAFNLANIEYKKEISNRDLYPGTMTESITFNEFTAEISYNATWSDKKSAFSDDVMNVTSSVRYTPSTTIYVPNTSTTTKREHNIQNLNCSKRAILDINVSAAAKPSKNIDFAIKEVNLEITRIKGVYGLNSTTTLLQNRSVTRNNSTKTFSVNETYAYNGGIVT